MRVYLYSAVLILLSALPARAAINILLDYGETSAENIATYGPTFESAVAFWQSHLTGYRDGALAPSAVTIGVTLANIDGAGGTLGSAGPSIVNIQGSFMETLAGGMTFDTSDLGSLVAANRFDDVIRHEMGHVLGLGSLWSSSAVGIPGFQELYVSGSGQYTGEAALDAFKLEFNQPDATFIPVELDGGLGTANGHWNMGIDLGVREEPDSRDDPGDGIVYTSVNNGYTLDDELMSGFLTGEAWLSYTSLQGFYDIGFEVAITGPIPEPAAASFIAASISALCASARRRRVVPTKR